MITYKCTACLRDKVYYKFPKNEEGLCCINCLAGTTRGKSFGVHKDRTDSWIESERARHREKYHRLGYKEKHKPTPEAKKAIMERYKSRYPEKHKAKSLSGSLKPSVKGNHLHHWNYNIEFAKDVIELSEPDHAKVHRFIKYDQATFMYMDLNGNLLDTREKHENYINAVLLLP